MCVCVCVRVRACEHTPSAQRHIPDQTDALAEGGPAGFLMRRVPCGEVQVLQGSQVDIPPGGCAPGEGPPHHPRQTI
eukprot:9474917-Pyramimonas_sp.AAC.1